MKETKPCHCGRGPALVSLETKSTLHPGVTYSHDICDACAAELEELQVHKDKARYAIAEARARAGKA